VPSGEPEKLSDYIEDESGGLEIDVPVNPPLPDLDSRVCRGTPRLEAAPIGPPITPSACRNALSIISLSRFARFAISGSFVADDRGTTVRSIPASYASMVSRPKEVTDIITSAAESARPESAKATHP
jgi:hypothetical protein